MKATCHSLLLVSLVLYPPRFSFARFQSAARATLASENFSINYSVRDSRRDAAEALGILESARSDVQSRISRAGLTGHPPPTLTVHAFETTGDFVGTTGQPPWVSATTRNGRIEVQPLSVLKRRGLLQSTLRHEYVHAVIGSLARGHAQHWLMEGLAIYVSNEGAGYRGVKPVSMDSDELDRRLENPTSAQEMRVLYAIAYRKLVELIKAKGEPSAWRQLTSY